MSKHNNFIGDPILKYLEVFGLKHNPFALNSAEDELIFQNDEADQKRSADRFFNYFVPFEDDILNKLKKDTHSIIFGGQGSGKTTLRFNLEAEIRSQYTESLVSTLIFPKETNINSDTQDFWLLLSEALATDLIVQVIENFLFHETKLKDFDSLLLELTKFVALFRLERNLKIISKRKQNNYPLHIWPLLNRPVVNHIRFSEEKVERLGFLWQNINRVDDSNVDYEEEAKKLLGLMHRFGYTKVYLSVDFASSISSDNLKWLTFQLELMLASLSTTPTLPSQQPKIFSKWFLPSQIELSKSSFLKDAEQIYIQWNPEGLEELIANRFQSAQSYRRTIAELSEDKMKNWVDKELVNHYNNPRDLLKAIQALLNAHIQNAYPSSDSEFGLYLTVRDWDTVKRKCGKLHMIPGNISHKYVPDFFVGRDKEIAIALDWQENDLYRPFLVIRGKPKRGKSWLIYRLTNEYWEHQRCKIIHIPFSDFSSLSLDESDNDIDPHLLQRNRAQRIWEKVKELFFTEGHFSESILNSSNDFKELLSSVQERGNLFVFDGLDQIELEDLPIIEREYVEPIYTASAEFDLKLVVAARENFQFENYQINKKSRRIDLPAFSKDEGEQQFEKIVLAIIDQLVAPEFEEELSQYAAIRQSSTDLLNKLRHWSSLVHYDDISPGVNKYIIDTYLDDNLDIDNINSHFIKTLLVRMDLFEDGEFNDELWDHLKAIAALEDNWTESEFIRKYAEISDRNSINQRELLKFLNIYIEKNLVYPVINLPGLFTLLEELLPFLRVGLT